MQVLCRVISEWPLKKVCSEAQWCSCLFVSGRTVVYRSHYKRPEFPPKVDFGGPNYRLQASHVAYHVDWPRRTLFTVIPARQDAVLLRRMTTTALVRRFRNGCFARPLKSTSEHRSMVNNRKHSNSHELIRVSPYVIVNHVTCETTSYTVLRTRRTVVHGMEIKAKHAPVRPYCRIAYLSHVSCVRLMSLTACSAHCRSVSVRM